MLLRSGNDAALAVAEVCAGSVENFAAQMNQKAQALGMADSHFVNPNGLNDEEHYSSAYDMALLARACLENETLREMVSTLVVALILVVLVTWLFIQDWRATLIPCLAVQSHE